MPEAPGTPSRSRVASSAAARRLTAGFGNHMIIFTLSRFHAFTLSRFDAEAEHVIAIGDANANLL
jgi:hypothetical protein